MIWGGAERAERGKDFRGPLYDTFLENIIKSLHDITVDVKEYVSICRSLWSQYTEPLRKSKIRKTLNAAMRDSAEMQLNSTMGDSGGVQPDTKQVISILDRRFQPRLRAFMEKGFSAGALVFPVIGGSRSAADEVHDLPVMTKYLLLAAFLCQINRPDRDRELLSIEKNGRRRRSSGHRDNDEENAFGSNVEESKSLQRRYFPAERMLSVFNSIVSNLDDSAATIPARDKVSGLRAVESMSFYNNVSFLRDIGMIHEHGHRQCDDTIRLRDPKYSCPLTKEDAKSIATTINFPLGRFMK